MCGIAGCLHIHSGSPSIELLGSMKEKLIHRGPDGDGVYINKRIGLAHTRLSIIDLHESSDQPMHTSDGRYSIVFNGEIFNYKELKEELLLLGAVFNTKSDTEVLLKAYQYWGEECFNKLNGMWALAIWDHVEEELVLSRDRFGIKPLYYVQEKDRILFSSEVKAMLVPGGVKADPNKEWFCQYIHVGYSDTGEETFFRNIKQFPKAKYARIGRHGKISFETYWKFDVDEFRIKYDYKNPFAQLKSLVEDSIKLRLRSDVDVGSCLSGGLDSSTIVCIASELLKKNSKHIQTFTSLFKEPGYDEKEFAEAVVDKANAQAHYLFPEAKEAMQFSVLGAYNLERPSAGPTLISQLNVMRKVHQHVKVVLDGQGVDEYLAGYHPFYISYMYSLYQRFLKEKSISTFAHFVWAFLSIARSKDGRDYARKFVDAYIDKVGNEGLLKRLPGLVARLFIPGKAKQTAQSGPLPNLIHPSLLEDVSSWEHVIPQFELPFQDELDNVLYQQFFYVSIPTLLALEDANSMAFSVEARVPFLDYRIVEFIFGLKMDLKISGWKTKYVLRRAMKNILPKKVEKRKDKKGYPTPYAVWLRGELREEVANILFSDELRSRKLFDENAIKYYWEEHQKGETDYSWAIYKVLSTELWFRLFIDKTIEPPVMNRYLSNVEQVDEPCLEYA